MCIRKRSDFIYLSAGTIRAAADPDLSFEGANLLSLFGNYSFLDRPIKIQPLKKVPYKKDVRIKRNVW